MPFRGNEMMTKAVFFYLYNSALTDGLARKPKEPAIFNNLLESGISIQRNL